MARYIDADELKKRAYPFPCAIGVEYAVSIRQINEQPTADVVEVVRCKDCIYKTVTEDGEYNPEDIVCEYHMSDGFDSDDYCSYGERKDDKND